MHLLLLHQQASQGLLNQLEYFAKAALFQLSLFLMTEKEEAQRSPHRNQEVGMDYKQNPIRSFKFKSQSRHVIMCTLFYQSKESTYTTLKDPSPLEQEEARKIETFMSNRSYHISSFFPSVRHFFNCGRKIVRS